MTAHRWLAGRYRLDTVLGQGALGEVWRAWDVVLDREVALKRLKLAEGGFDALRAEFRAAATVRHPNIVEVFDLVARPGVQAFYSMELCDAVPFDVACEGLPPARVLHLAHQAVEALAHLHKAGVLHGDLKPTNLLVDRRTRGHLTVVDFGHASARALRGLHGTPAYLAPEVVRGGAHDVRSELYALGAVLYEALTGGNPFVGADAVETLGRQIDLTPPPVHRVCPDLEPAIGALLAKLLEKDPARRHPSFEALGDALAALIVEDAAELSHQRPQLATPPLAGRADAMTAVQVLLAGLDVGSGACLSAAGDRGSGRTRFSSEVRLAAELEGRPTGALRMTGAAADGARLDAAVGAMIGEVPDGDPIDALADLLDRAPSVLVVDDADRASPTLFPRLGRLLQLTREAPLFVVLTASDAPGDAESGQALARALSAAAARGHAWQVELAPLDGEAMTVLVGGALGGSADPASLVEPLRHASGGLPRAAITLLEQLASGGALERHDGVWFGHDTQLPGDQGRGAMRAAFAARTAALAPDVRRVLAALAPVGEACRPELAAITGLPEPRLRSAIDAAVVDRLVRARGARDGQPCLEPVDTELAACALSQLEPDVRQKMVREGARSLGDAPTKEDHGRWVRAARAAIDVGETPSATRLVPPSAAHAEAQGDNTLALGLWRDLAALEPTLDALRQTARLAFAVGEYRQVVAALDTDPGPPPQLAAAAAESLARLGRADDAKAAALGLVAAVEAHADGALRANMALTAARVLRLVGATDEARRAAESGLGGAEGDVPDAVLSALLRELATLDWQGGRADDAVGRAKRALTLARRSRDARVVGEASMALGTALRTAGRSDEAIPLYEDAARQFAADGALGSLGKARNNIGVCHYLAGRVEAAAEAWREALRVAEVTAERDEQIILLNNLGFMYLERGAHALAEKSLDEALSLAADDATAGFRLAVLGNLAEVRMQQGALSAAHECLDEAIALAVDRGARGDAVENQRRRAELLLLENEPHRATEVARAALADAMSLGLHREEGHLCRVKALAALRLGRVARARRFLDRAAETGALSPDSLDGQLLALAYAELELVAGTPERARSLVDEAVSALTELGAAWHADQARLLVARVEARSEAVGRRDDTPSLDRAIDLIHAAASPREVAEHAVALALDACKAEHCTLYLEPTPAHEALRVSVADPHLRGSEDELGEFSQTVARRVLADGVSVCLQHVEDDNTVASAESVIAMHVRSVLCVAVRLEGKVGGLIYVDSRVHVGSRFQRALPAIERLAGLVGMALDRMRLSDRVASQTGLLSVVAHELRSPLTTLMGFAELAMVSAGAEAEEHAATLVGVVLEEGGRMRRLVDDVSALGRAWRFTLDKAAEVTVRMLLEGAQRRARPAAAARGVQLVVDIADGLPAVFADTERIQQVLGNLIENALRHSPHGGHVTLRAAHEPFGGRVGERRALRLSVEDEGPGVRPEDASAIFERFNRGSRPVGSGSGLGLSIAQSIVHAHGGRIWVDPTRPGARFHFTLPIASHPRDD